MALTQSFAVGPMAGFSSYPMEEGPEGLNQTFKKGDLLVVSSGTLVAAGADPTAGTLVGLALNDAHNTTAGAYQVSYIPLLPGLVFTGQIQNAAANATLAYATHMYAEFGINVTSNKWWIDTDETSHKDVVIVGFQDAVGTLNGVVRFVFKPLATIYGTAVT